MDQGFLGGIEGAMAASTVSNVTSGVLGRDGPDVNEKVPAIPWEFVDDFFSGSKSLEIGLLLGDST